MDKIRKAKALLDLNLVRDLKGNKKGLYKHIGNKRKTGENMNPLLNRAGKLLTEDTETDRILSTFLASVFTSTTGLQGCQAHETVESLEQGILTLSGGGSHWGIFKLHRQKSMLPERLHPQVLRELMDVFARQPLVVFERSWGTGYFWGVGGSIVSPVFKSGKKLSCSLGNYRPDNLNSILGKVTEQLIMKISSSHMKDKKVTGSSQHGFIKGRSVPTNLKVFYNDMTALVDKGKTVDVVYLNFSKTWHSFL